MEWLDQVFKDPIGHVFWLALGREPGKYTLFYDRPPTCGDIDRSVVLVKVVVIQKIVVYGPKERE